MRIDGVNLGGAVLPANMASIFDRMNIGDIVRARIVEIFSNEILMKLFDGTTFTAVSVSHDNNISKGDFVEFKVTGKTDNQLFVEMVNVKKDSAADTDMELSKLLESMGIKPDKTSIEIVKSLKSREMPVQKETVIQVLNALKNYSELDIEKAVFLLSGNMEIEENNISSLDKFINEKFKIGNALMELIELLEEVPDDAFLERITNDLEAFNNTQNTGNSDLETYSGISNGNSGNEPVSKQSGIQVGTSEEKDSSAVFDVINDKTVMVKQDGEVSPSATRHFTDNMAVKAETDAEAEIEMKADKQFTDINLIKNDIDDNGKTDENKKTSFLRKMFEKSFVSVDSETLSDDLSITKNYKEIVRLLKTVKSNLNPEKIHQYGDRINNLIDSIENSIRFLNELNNYHTYVHIPIKLSNENTTAELYVFKKKSRKKAIDPEDSVVYISLDTINLGRVDTLISIKRKNISLNFTIESKEVINFFKDNFISLYNRLMEKGYKLVNVSYTQMNDNTNIINIHKKTREIFGDKDKRSLDIRI